ncbi:hypothetical protein [Burkholderia pseudomallei]|uniref:hypothetical protein n=1 Tax=Burkholderia pseudomallei TaxID=28450 RepID=UPI000F059A15|nr:hypothetical protein [Burkholderia pseudomallei]
MAAAVRVLHLHVLPAYSADQLTQFHLYLRVSLEFLWHTFNRHVATVRRTSDLPGRLSSLHGRQQLLSAGPSPCMMILEAE